MRRVLSILAGAGIGILALIYVVTTIHEAATTGASLAVPLSSALLVTAWVWFLAVARSRRNPWARLGLHLAAVGVCVLLGLLAGVSAAHESVLGPALAITLPLTILYLGAFYLRRAFLIMLIVAAGLVGAGYTYFGAALILIGLLALPRRLGPYLRELFPGRVTEEGS